MIKSGPHTLHYSREGVGVGGFLYGVHFLRYSTLEYTWNIFTIQQRCKSRFRK